MAATRHQGAISDLSLHLRELENRLERERAETVRIAAERQAIEHDIECDIRSLNRSIQILQGTKPETTAPSVSAESDASGNGDETDQRGRQLTEGTQGFYAAKVLTEAGEPLSTVDVATKVRRMTTKWNDKTITELCPSLYSAMWRRMKWTPNG